MAIAWHVCELWHVHSDLSSLVKDSHLPFFSDGDFASCTILYTICYTTMCYNMLHNMHTTFTNFKYIKNPSSCIPPAGLQNVYLPPGVQAKRCPIQYRLHWYVLPRPLVERPHSDEKQNPKDSQKMRRASVLQVKMMCSEKAESKEWIQIDAPVEGWCLHSTLPSTFH